MKILKLESENIKKISVVEIVPDGNLVQITGKNGSGKTSVLDSIMYALQGVATVCKVPLRKGTKKGHVRLDLGELIVTRKFTENGSTLTVENASGLTHKTPQAVLDRLMGSIAFDPLAFSRQKPKEQFDTLRGLVKLDIDLEQIDGANDRNYRERAELNKSAKQKRATLALWPMLPDELPEEKIDTGALVDEIAAAGKHNAEIDKEKDRRKRLFNDDAKRLTDAKAAREQAAGLREQAEKLRAQADKEERNAARIEQEVEAARAAPQTAIPDPIDPSEVRKRLSSADDINRLIDKRAAQRELVKDAETVERHAAELTARMEAREQQKRDAIAAAKMPIEGIGFGDGMVMLNGVPFDQGSDAEQLRASCAIAMAANPKLRVLRIRDGSLLDEGGLKLLAEMADAQDYQVWIERVTDGGKVGIVLEDGHIKAAVDAEKELVTA